MKRFFMLIAIFMCVTLTGCQTIAREERISVTATVTDMEYHSLYITMIPVYSNKTTTLIPQTHPARFLVTITYQNVSETFDNKELYNQVKEGDTIQMTLSNQYDTSGKLVKQTLQLN